MAGQILDQNRRTADKAVDNVAKFDTKYLEGIQRNEIASMKKLTAVL